MSTETDKVNTGALATIIVAGAMFVAGVASGVTALVRHETTLVGDEVGANADLGTVQKLKADQKAELAAPPAWDDKDKGIATIPIKHAMQLVVGEIEKNPEAATPAAPPAAPTADAGAPAEDKGAAPADDKPAKPKPAKPTHKPAVPPAPAPAPAPQPAPGGNAP